MQRRTLGTREALEGILEDAATPTRAFASDYGYDLVSLLLPGDECSYVMGNPPFIGHQQHTQQIKDDMELVCGKAGGSLDYVAGWYFKAIDFLDGNPSAQFAFSAKKASKSDTSVPSHFGPSPIRKSQNCQRESKQ